MIADGVQLEIRTADSAARSVERLAQKFRAITSIPSECFFLQWIGGGRVR